MNFFRKVFFLQLALFTLIMHCKISETTTLIEFQTLFRDYSNEAVFSPSFEDPIKDFLTGALKSCENVTDVIFQLPQDNKNLIYWVLSNNRLVTREQLLQCYQNQVKGNQSAKVDAPYPGSCAARYFNGFTFPCAQAQVTTFSIDLCRNGAPQASLRCDYVTKSTDYGLLRKVDFDTQTLQTTRCNYTIADILWTMNTSIASLNEQELKKEIQQLNLQLAKENLAASEAKDAAQALTYIFPHMVQTNQKISDEVFSLFLETISKLSQIYLKFNDDNQITPEDKSKLVDQISKTARLVHINENTRSKKFVTETLTMQVNQLTEESSKKAFASEINSADTGEIAIEVTISPVVIASAFARSRSSKVGITVAAFASDADFSSSETAQGVVSVELYDPSNPENPFQISNVDNAVSIYHKYETKKFGRQNYFTNETEANKSKFLEFECVYWDEKNLAWENKGCYYDVCKEPSCVCNHLTSFAVLLNIYSSPENLSLTIVTYIGCGISIALLILTMILHLLNKNVRNQIPVKIQLNIHFNLLLGYGTFLLGIEKANENTTCSVIASVLHFAFLASFFWMGVYGRQLYKSFWIQNIYITEHRFLLLSSFVAYGMPFAIVAFTNGISYGYFDTINQNPLLGCPAQSIPQNRDFYQWTYRSSQYCWLHKETLYCSFLIVIGLVLLYNITIAIMVFKKISRKNTKIRSTVPKMTQIKQILLVVTLTFSLGITWFIGLFLLLDNSSVYQSILNWVFVVLNAFQGIFIFIITCIRRKDMFDFWFAPIARKCNCLRSSNKSQSTAQLRKQSADNSDSNSSNLRFLQLPQRNTEISTVSTDLEAETKR